MSKTKVIVGAAAAVGGAVVFMTAAAGDDTRWGVKVFRALGLAPRHPWPFIGVTTDGPFVQNEEKREERNDPFQN
jgi:hypothetical protein